MRNYEKERSYMNTHTRWASFMGIVERKHETLIFDSRYKCLLIQDQRIF